ncbi:putative Rapid response to glucose protein 1 [Glarea lozoyensis 74030]|uniref:Putative Rapid response to glucose protein 1 n=1 Tax=Glarea lozoyensis (strain ATCC 74030 / MF5533) TaxID=1104152 RepID=H0EGT2_GLAL7|nr:putative Rapid response to glucose protein 1 [Glarea lozoyensis 74030]
MPPTNALDLPLLRQKPSYETLVNSLEALTIAPSTWSESEISALAEEDAAGIPRYLTSILSNAFDWLQDQTSEKSHGLLAEEQKEVLWNLASQRMTERCGRSAQGEITRTWRIAANGDHPDMDLVIREPPLTGDTLGFKTWGTAWAIAQKLTYLKTELFQHLLREPTYVNFTNENGETFTQIKRRDSLERPQILELGSGTGLLGLAAAAIWSADVIVTDLEIIQENLGYNCFQNMNIIESRGGYCAPGVLDWTDLENSEVTVADNDDKFELIMVSDPLYDSHHPALVANAIRHFIKVDEDEKGTFFNSATLQAG